MATMDEIFQFSEIFKPLVWLNINEKIPLLVTGFGYFY